MPSDTVSRLGQTSGLRRGGHRQDELWLGIVGSVDAILRAYHGIREFTDDPDCVFRLGMAAARRAVTLADGTRIDAGEPIGSLHLWNEHLPPYKHGGPDLAWAAEMRKQADRSLRLLADWIERNPEWQDIRAFRGDAMLSRRLGDRQIRRIAERYGFERVAAPMSLRDQLHLIGDCLNTWALTRAFNPAALQRQGFLRYRSELWISRRALLERYGRQRQRRAAPRAGRGV